MPARLNRNIFLRHPTELSKVSGFVSIYREKIARGGQPHYTTAFKEQQMEVTPLTPYEELPSNLTMAEFMTWSRTGRSLAYELVKSGELQVIKFGRSIRVPKSSLKVWVMAEDTSA
jgi:excisionase family DNA binding protein